MCSQSGALHHDENDTDTNSPGGFSVGGIGRADLKSDKTHGCDSPVEVSEEQNQKDVCTFKILVSHENLWENMISPLSRRNTDMIWIRVTLNNITRKAILKVEETHNEGIQ